MLTAGKRQFDVHKTVCDEQKEMGLEVYRHMYLNDTVEQVGKLVPVVIIFSVGYSGAR